MHPHGIAGLLLASTWAIGQAPVLVRDVNASALPNGSSSPTAFVEAAGRCFFRAWHHDTGEELFVSDGTAAGTRLVKDIRPGTSGSSPASVVALGPLVFFVANDGASGVELWRSDGTPTGTWLIQDIAAGAASSTPAGLVVVGSRLYFAADDGVNGQELWRSDGTAAGTQLVADIRPGAQSSAPSWLVPLGSMAVFTADDGIHGQEVWRTQGTAATTAMVVDLNAGWPSSLPSRLTPFRGAICYTAYTIATGEEVWRTDGTGAGTVLLADMNPGSWHSGPALLTPAGATLFLVATRGSTGAELWKSDGTSAGTTLVPGLRPSPSLLMWPERLAAIGSSVTVFGEGAPGKGIYRTDGTPAGTTRLSTSEPVGFASGLSGVFFWTMSASAGIELWFSDGTAAGTRRLSSATWEYAIVTLPGGKALFAGGDGRGTEPWITDGTPAGTSMLVDLAPVPPGSLGAGVAHLREWQGMLFFQADDGATGPELWVSDGTAAGTRLVLDIVPGPQGSDPVPLAALSDRMLFSATGGLWATDGTPQGTALVRALTLPAPLKNRPVRWRDRAWFAADDGIHGFEPWTSDGTSAGTYLVRDLLPAALGSSPYGWTAFADEILFFGRVGSWVSLCRTDGTAAGTVAVKSGPATNPWLGALYPTPVDGHRLFFVADVPGGPGPEVWFSDGTAAGTQRMLTAPAYSPFMAGAIGSRIVMSLPVAAGHDFVISDGTSAGTVTLRASLQPLWPGRAFRLGANLCFAGYDPVVRQSGLWRTDGTPAGTVPIAAPVAGIGEQTATSGSRFGWFTGTLQESGEVFVTDGTSAGTSRVTRFAAAQRGAWGDIVLANGHVFFVADDGQTGRELWMLDPGASSQALGEPCATLRRAPTLRCSDPVLGRAMQLEARDAYVGSLALPLLGARAARALRLGMGCAVELELATIVPLVVFRVSQPDWTGSLAIPNDAALLGLRLALQVAYLGTDAPRGFDLSNGVLLVVGT